MKNKLPLMVLIAFWLIVSVFMLVGIANEAGVDPTLRDTRETTVEIRALKETPGIGLTAYRIIDRELGVQCIYVERSGGGLYCEKLAEWEEQ